MRTWTAAIAILAVIVCTGFYAVDRHEVRNSAGWIYFNQVITGNWSSQQPDKNSKLDGKYISDAWYMAGLIGAIVINFGPLIAIISAALALLERKTEMNLLAAFASRDLNIEVSLVTSVTQSAEKLIAPGMQEEFLKVVHAAIAEAKNDWWGPNLDERFGREQAARMRVKMMDLTITP